MIMIDPKELRIGNWISFGDIYFHVAIDDIGTLQIRNEDGHIHCLGSDILQDVSPITIDREWLDRMGFSLTIDNTIEVYERILRRSYGLVKEIAFFDINDGFGVSLSDTEIGVKSETFVVDLDIEYVHQLQNLYYALTGQELEVKEMVK